jgi:hypothetical protein
VPRTVPTPASHRKGGDHHAAAGLPLRPRQPLRRLPARLLPQLAARAAGPGQAPPVSPPRDCLRVLPTGQPPTTPRPRCPRDSKRMEPTEKISIGGNHVLWSKRRACCAWYRLHHPGRDPPGRNLLVARRGRAIRLGVAPPQQGRKGSDVRGSQTSRTARPAAVSPPAHRPGTALQDLLGQGVAPPLGRPGRPRTPPPARPAAWTSTTAPSVLSRPGDRQVRHARLARPAQTHSTGQSR